MLALEKPPSLHSTRVQQTRPQGALQLDGVVEERLEDPF